MLVTRFCLLTAENRSRQITKLEGDFGALNDSESYNHQKVRRCSQNVQNTNTKFSKTDIISGGVKNYMCLPKINRAYQARVVEDESEPERTLPEKNTGW